MLVIDIMSHRKPKTPRDGELMRRRRRRTKGPSQTAISRGLRRGGRQIGRGIRTGLRPIGRALRRLGRLSKPRRKRKMRKRK